LQPQAVRHVFLVSERALDHVCFLRQLSVVAPESNCHLDVSTKLCICDRVVRLTKADSQMLLVLWFYSDS